MGLNKLHQTMLPLLIEHIDSLASLGQQLNTRWLPEGSLQEQQPYQQRSGRADR